MKVGGFGDLERVRKVNQRENAGTPAEAPVGAEASGGPQDAVEISGQAKMMAKLSQVPDVRTERVEALREKDQAGELVTPENVRKGLGNLLRRLLG